MRLAKRTTDLQEGDMTPMIDMVFQLIAFFMVLINFTEADQNQRIRLPSSELAKPAEVPIDSPITIHVTADGTALLGTEEVPIQGLTRLLTIEYQVLVRKGDGRASQATIVIRGDGITQFGLVQEVIQICQNVGFEKFALRAKQQEALSRGISSI